jgi:hypothetical protein
VRILDSVADLAFSVRLRAAAQAQGLMKSSFSASTVYTNVTMGQTDLMPLKSSRGQATVSLASTIVKAACFLATGNVADAAASIIDLIEGHVNDVLDRRKIERMFDECADVVTRKLQAVMEQEFRDVPENEQIAAIVAVQDTFLRGGMSLQGLVAADLDARSVERALANVTRAVLREALLSPSAEELYRLVLRESCAYLVESATTFPDFQATALQELLRRGTGLAENLDRILRQLPQQRGMNLFEVDYRRLIVNRLDRMELFGITNLRASSQRYPLSVAYVSLGALGWSNVRESSINVTGKRVEDALADERRILLVGEAGSGKTTLLRWLAVRSAANDFSGALSGWRECIPFMVPLRHYAEQNLPGPEGFLIPTASNLAGEMPAGWVHDALRSGKALVLVDGVDELREGRPRAEARRWLRELVSDFPDARYIVTSRPTAVYENWLEREGFVASELQPMSRYDIQAFVEQWHVAMAEQVTSADEFDRIPSEKRSLLAAIEADRHLRNLAVNPLLCAMLCALNREWHQRLPRERMDIYEAALTMLGGRDSARGVYTTSGVTPNIQILLLQDLAYWLVTNGWSDVQCDRAERRIELALASLPKVTASAPFLLRHLRDRSGLLREPEQGRIAFVHRTFQEYLAGKAAVEEDHIGQLIDHADDDQWREVVTMASGHAQPRQCTELIRGLLNRSDRFPEHRHRLRLLALACMHSARKLDPELRVEVQGIAHELIPPRNIQSAESLATAGDLVIDLLNKAQLGTAEEAVASIRTATLIGGNDAIDLIASIVPQFREEAQQEALRSWRFFEPERYAIDVLAQSGPFDTLEIDDPSLIPGLRHLPGLRDLRLSLPQQWTSALDGIGEISDLTELLINCSLSMPDRRPLERCEQLTSLEIVKCGDSSFRPAGSRPRRLQALTINAWPFLTSIQGLEDWDGITSLTLLNCTDLADLSAISKVTSLKTLSLRAIATRDISPLADLPQLRELRLGGFANINLTPFARISDLRIVVSARARVTGDDQLGSGSELVRV